MIFYNYYKSFYSTDASFHTHRCVCKCSPSEQLIRRLRTGRRGGLRLHFIREIKIIIISSIAYVYISHCCTFIYTSDVVVVYAVALIK